MSSYDVVICGCGPAGIAAGTSLARRGYSVAMVDKARFPRQKLCGGLLTWKSLKLLQAVFGETPESLIDAGVINYVSDQFSLSTYKATLAAGRLAIPFHFVDRMAFDAHLLEHARKAGAEIFEGASVKDVAVSTGCVSLANGNTLQGTYVLGSDGVNSRVRRVFSDWNRPRWKRYLAPALEITLPQNLFPREVTHPELIVGFLDAGYGWVFPNKENVIVGMCGLRHKQERFTRLFRDYLQFLGVSHENIEYHGHPLPYGHFCSEPVQGRVLLAGDAAGFVEPLFGEGIFYALCSGYYAGEALADGLDMDTHPGPAYTKRLRRYIFPEMKASNCLRWLIFQSMHTLGSRSLGAFVQLGVNPLAEMVHGLRSYAWLRKKYWDF